MLLGVWIGPASIAKGQWLANSNSHPAVPNNGIHSDGIHSNGINDSLQWLADVERIRSRLTPEQIPDLSLAESNLLNQIAATQSYFRRASTSQNYEAWMRYLNFEPLTDAITEDASVSVRGRAAIEIRSKMRGVERGLELRAMVSLRESLDRYIVALRYSNRGVARIESQLDSIVDLLSPEKSARSWRELSAEEIDKLELLLSSLVDVGQARDLAMSVRSRFSQPNLHVWINGQTITDAIARPVNNPTEVNDCILGTRLLGRARVDGMVTAQLLPQDGYIRLWLRMDGQFTTTARGFRKPITLDSSGTAQVYASRQMAITEKSVVLGETIATANLTTRINRINHPLRIVRKIAARKASESKPLADRISERRLRQRIFDQFDSETSAAAKRTFPDIDQKTRPWLKRLDFPAITRTIGSTDRDVYVHASMQRTFGFSASMPAPSPSSIQRPVLENGSGSALATIQVHQSIVGNTIGPLLAGESFNPDRIARIAEVLEISLEPKSTEPKPTEENDTPGFEIDFANLRPVFIESDNQTLRLGIRGTRFSEGERELKRPLEVSAVYRPVYGVDGKAWLIRDEKIELTFPGTKRLSISQTAIKSNIEKGFDELFPKELLQREFQIPASLGMPALAGRTLTVGSIDLDNGWISVKLQSP